MEAMGVPKDQMRWQSGIMGVPVTFLDKYNPDQFEILGGFNGHSQTNNPYNQYVDSFMTEYEDKNGNTKIWNGPTIRRKTVYYRILIQKRRKNA